MHVGVDQEQSDGYTTTIIDPTETAQDYHSYIVIPTSVVAMNISPNAKLVYGLLDSFNHKRRTFFGSNKFIGHSIGTSPRSIPKLLKELEDVGLIRRVLRTGEDGGIVRASIEVIRPPETSYPIAKLPHPLPKIATPVTQNYEHTNKLTIKVTKEEGEHAKNTKALHQGKTQETVSEISHSTLPAAVIGSHTYVEKERENIPVKRERKTQKPSYKKTLEYARSDEFYESLKDWEELRNVRYSKEMHRRMLDRMLNNAEEKGRVIKSYPAALKTWLIRGIKWGDLEKDPDREYFAELERMAVNVPHE